MPTSESDSVSSALRSSLSTKETARELDQRLAASSAKILLSHIKYESVGSYNSIVLDKLKEKYIVLNTNSGATNGEAGCSSIVQANSKMRPEPDSVLPTPKHILFPAENVKLGWQDSSHPIGAGMFNVGNTCYLNSTLQALFHIPAFVNWLQSDSAHIENCGSINGNFGNECVICAMRKTLRDTLSKCNTAIKPLYIYTKLKLICKHLVHGQQEDAHEFLRYLIESMEKAYLNRCKGNKLDNYSKETTPLNQIFGGYIRTEVTCRKCRGVSTTFQHFQDLLLDIRRANTLNDALEAYFAHERLEGDDAYRCELCHGKVSASKKFSLEKPPMVLCIQLKRFSVLGGKLNKHVEFQQGLDMTRFLCPQSQHRAGQPLKYRLVSLVLHMGSSVNCGHYTAVAQTANRQWLNSCLLYDGQPGTVRDPESLPSLGGLVCGGDVSPVLKPESPFHILQALSNILTAAFTLHKGLDPQIWTSFCSKYLMDYISEIGINNLNMTNHWFTRIEIFYLQNLVTLFSMQGSEFSNAFHLLAIRLVSLTRSSNRIIVKKTLNVVFNHDIFVNCYNIEYVLRTLRLSDEFEASSAKHDVLKIAIEDIKSIQECYEDALQVKTFPEALPFEMKTLTLNFDTLVPNDWIFIPILNLYGLGSSGKSASHEKIRTMVKSLQWILLMECLCPSAISSISATARYSRLCTVFLAASDLFLDSTISQLLDIILQELLNYNNKIDFKESIPGLSSFYDLYSELLEQFAAVSYGSTVFGHVIIIPLQQRHSSDFRKLLWSEQAAVLRVLSVPLNQLKISLKELLVPCETDPSLLSTYLHCLATGAVQNKWSPVLYRVALHHVATFIKTTDSNVILVQQLKEKIKKLGNKELQAELLFYEDAF